MQLVQWTRRPEMLTEMPNIVHGLRVEAQVAVSLGAMLTAAGAMVAVVGAMVGYSLGLETAPREETLWRWGLASAGAFVGVASVAMAALVFADGNWKTCMVLAGGAEAILVLVQIVLIVVAWKQRGAPAPLLREAAVMSVLGVACLPVVAIGAADLWRRGIDGLLWTVGLGPPVT